MKRLMWGSALLAVMTWPSPGFGEDFDRSRFPLFPSLLNSVSGTPLPSSEFDDPTVCEECHPEIYGQWKGSMHSLAVPDPVFSALWKMALREMPKEMETFCAGCHTPIGTLAEEVKLKEDGTFAMSDIARKGVQCDFCHSVEAATMRRTPTGDPGNASLVVDPGEVKRGPYDDSDSDYHDTVYSDLHTRSEFCANCHNVFHPVSNFPIERTYDEWKNSVYAQAGIQCQDCHMMPVELAIETARTLKKQKNPGQPCVDGPQREHMYTHEFVGGNAVITKMLGSEKHAAVAVKRLRNAASVTLLLPESAVPGGLVRMKVRVRNETAGHNLPTSLTEVRQMWLEIKATDAAGNTLYHNGGLNEKGSVDAEAVIFNALAVDKDGHHTAKLWEIVRFEYNNTIPPKGSALVSYAFPIPADAKTPVGVEVTLHYRSFDQKLVDELLGRDTFTVPVIDMVSADGSIALTR